jgi:hypothetical protein
MTDQLETIRAELEEIRKLFPLYAPGPVSYKTRITQATIPGKCRYCWLNSVPRKGDFIWLRGEGDCREVLSVAWHDDKDTVDVDLRLGEYVDPITEKRAFFNDYYPEDPPWEGPPLDEESDEEMAELIDQGLV